MKEELKNNLREVGDEMSSVLSNMRAVRGDAYTDTVAAMLNLSQLIKLISMLTDWLKEGNPDIAKVVENSTERIMIEVIATLSRLTNFDDKVWNEAIADCYRINESVDNLLSSAVKRAEEGKSFGGTD